MSVSHSLLSASPSGVVQGALVGPLVKRLGEERVLLIGLLFGVLGFAAFGLASTGRVLFWVGVPVFAFWGLANASIQGMMSQHVAANEQGQLQGANGSLRGIAELIGPGIFSMTFAYFLETNNRWHLPGAPFLLAAFMIAVALVFSQVGRRTSE